MTRKQVLTILPAVVVIVVLLIATFVMSRQARPSSPGYAMFREPTVILPESMSMTKVYDAELDVICLVFVKKFREFPYFDMTTDCMPRSETDF